MVLPLDPAATPRRGSCATRHLLYTARDAAFRTVGANLAANLLEILDSDDIGLREKTAAAPYPRLRHLQQAVRGAVSEADPERGYRFIDPATGRALRLADIP